MLKHSNKGWEKKAVKHVDSAVTQGIKKGIIAGRTLIVPKVPVREGQLKNSIQSTMVNDGLGVIGTNVEYAGYVEYGTRKMKAQPYMRPGAFELRRVLGKIMAGFIKIATRKI